MLKVFYNSTDYSTKLEDYLTDTVTLTVSDTDFIYVGHRKPINALYIAMNTPSTGARMLSVEYYNGTAFVELDVKDKTLGLTRSGFVSWDRFEGEEETTINSLEKYWYRVSVSAATSATVFAGINLLLSDDLMLKEDEPHILSTDFYPTGQTSFIAFHQSARNDLIQRLRNKGKRVYGARHYDLNVFDLLDYSQLSMAAKYLALSKIYFNLSDSTEDKYYQKHRDYALMAGEAFEVFFLSIDENDDGVQSEEETAAFTTGIIQRS